MQTNDQISYSFYAQNRDDTIIIKNHLQNNFINTTANEILKTPILATSLSPEEMKIIRYIAESQPELRRAA